METGVRRILVAGGETSGAVVSRLGVRALRIGETIAPGVPWTETLLDPANPGVSIAWIAGISVLSIVLSFVLTLVIGFEDLPEEE